MFSLIGKISFFNFTQLQISTFFNSLIIVSCLIFGNTVLIYLINKSILKLQFKKSCFDDTFIAISEFQFKFLQKYLTKIYKFNKLTTYSTLVVINFGILIFEYSNNVNISRESVLNIKISSLKFAKYIIIFSNLISITIFDV